MRIPRALKIAAGVLGVLAIVLVALAAYVYRDLEAQLDAQLAAMEAQATQAVVVSDVATQLGPKATRFAVPEPLKVMGLVSQVCVVVAQGVPPEDDIDRQFERLTAGTHFAARLHAADGQHYTWTSDGWAFNVDESRPETDRLYACLDTERAANAQLPAGTTITSLQLRASRPFRILGVTWKSSSSMDFFNQPPPDVEATASDEYGDLEHAFGAQAAWPMPATPVLKVELARSHPNQDKGAAFSDYRSSLALRLGEDALQLQPLEMATGMQVLTIPADAVGACGVDGGFRGRSIAQLFLANPRMKLDLHDAPDVVEWCRRNRKPLLSCREKSAWMYRGAPLPTAESRAAQFASIEAYRPPSCRPATASTDALPAHWLAATH
jgi:hypothetical protein